VSEIASHHIHEDVSPVTRCRRETLWRTGTEECSEPWSSAACETATLSHCCVVCNTTIKKCWMTTSAMLQYVCLKVENIKMLNDDQSSVTVRLSLKVENIKMLNDDQCSVTVRLSQSGKHKNVEWRPVQCYSTFVSKWKHHMKVRIYLPYDITASNMTITMGVRHSSLGLYRLCSALNIDYL